MAVCWVQPDETAMHSRETHLTRKIKIPESQQLVSLRAAQAATTTIASSDVGTLKLLQTLQKYGYMVTRTGEDAIRKSSQQLFNMHSLFHLVDM